MNEDVVLDDLVKGSKTKKVFVILLNLLTFISGLFLIYSLYNIIINIFISS